MSDLALYLYGAGSLVAIFALAIVLHELWRNDTKNNNRN